MQKYVIIINGKGGCGKDTLCTALKYSKDFFKIRIISSITPIKSIATKYGDWNGKKTMKSRKFLSDLKRLFIEFNDLPYKYVIREYKNFLKTDHELLFIHVRESEEIDKVKTFIMNDAHADCMTLLIKSDRTDGNVYDNDSDDNVENYEYDYIFTNNKPLEESKAEFEAFLKDILSK